MNIPVDKKNPRKSHESVWQRVRALKQFRTADLARLRLYDSSIDRYLQALVKAGYLDREHRVHRPGAPAHFSYKVARDAPEAPRVKADGTEDTSGAGRKSLWRSMRILKTFTVTDLVACSSTPSHTVASEEARTYVTYLARAGYLRRLDLRGMAYAAFKLVRYTGPKAPMIQRIKQVWDPNLKKVVWRPKDEEAPNAR